jgi:prepilin-type N-terminal cleavage/methylation domain-containing protein/prepilin-type processing-associated H-X9-DG protein
LARKGNHLDIPQRPELHDLVWIFLLKEMSDQETDRAHRSSTGFTLIELLVVIAIIAVLAGLLLPALSAGKEAGRSALCKSHLHQHGLALTMYGEDSGVYPIEWSDRLAIGQARFTEWCHALMPYVRTNLDFTRCPSAPADAKFTNVPPKIWTGFNFGGGIQVIDDFPRFERRSYGLNCPGSGYLKGLGGDLRALKGGLGFGVGVHLPTADAYLRVSSVAQPSNFIAIGDSQADKREDNMIGVVPSMGASPGEAWPGTRHRKGANVVFCDGHVESDSQTNWIRKTESARSRWNFDNRPHPETWID